MEMQHLKVTVNGRVYNISIGELESELKRAKSISFIVKPFANAPQATHWQAGTLASRKAPALAR